MSTKRTLKVNTFFETELKSSTLGYDALQFAAEMGDLKTCQ